MEKKSEKLGNILDSVKIKTQCVKIGAIQWCLEIYSLECFCKKIREVQNQWSRLPSQKARKEKQDQINEN